MPSSAAHRPSARCWETPRERDFSDSSDWPSTSGRILFTDKYAELYEQSFALLSKTGLYTGEMISQMALMVQSPLWITFSSVAGQALLGLLFGLVLAALAQPRQRFDNNTEE